MQIADGAPCGAYSYQAAGQPKALGSIYSKMILVSFPDEYTHEQAVAAAAGYGFIEELGQPVRTNSARMYPVKLVEGLNCKQVGQAIRQLQLDPNIAYAAPYFLTEEDGMVQLRGISNEFLVTISGQQQAELIVKRLANATKTVIVTALDDNTFVLRADKNSRGNALEMANFFQEQPAVKQAEPDFVVSLDL
ncbi:hypothetical protein [Pontibacter sp. HJ8]